MTSTTSATTANTTVPTPFSCSDSSGWRGRRDSSNSANCSKYSILALASSCSRRISSSRRACSPLGSRMQSKYSCPGANRCTGSVRCCFLRYSFITPKVTTFPPKPHTNPIAFSTKFALTRIPFRQKIAFCGRDAIIRVRLK